MSPALRGIAQKAKTFFRKTPIFGKIPFFWKNSQFSLAKTFKPMRKSTHELIANKRINC